MSGRELSGPQTEREAVAHNRVALQKSELNKSKAGSLMAGNPALEQWEVRP